MLVVKSSIDGCDYETPDADSVIAVTLITANTTSYPTPCQPRQTALVEKVK